MDENGMLELDDFYLDIAKACYRLIKSDYCYAPSKKLNVAQEFEVLTELAEELTQYTEIRVFDLIEVIHGRIDVSNDRLVKIAYYMEVLYTGDINL